MPGKMVCKDGRIIKVRDRECVEKKDKKESGEDRNASYVTIWQTDVM